MVDSLPFQRAGCAGDLGEQLTRPEVNKERGPEVPTTIQSHATQDHSQSLHTPHSYFRGEVGKDYTLHGYHVWQ
jgi:hypothetical protein